MNDSPIEQWLAEFAQDPQAALDRLLLGRAFMGALNRNELSAILFRLFHAENRETQERLDEALRGWLAAVWLTAPDSMSASRWAEILEQAFFTVHRLNLAKSRRWLISHYPSGKDWLRSLYLSPACDPEGCLLRTLAMNQEDQQLAPLWLRFCRREEELPRHYAAIGLIGLRKLPDRNGRPPGDLPSLVFSALAGLAEAAEAKEGEQFWLRECRSLRDLYPRTDHYWIKNFLPFISSGEHDRTAKLLRKVIPDFTRKAEKVERGKNVWPPSYKELQNILTLLQKHSVQAVRTEVDAFLHRHRCYAQQTGLSEVLVKVFCEIGGKIYRRQIADAKFARQLLEEAFLWEPYEPHVWTIRAQIEAQLGRHSQAAALLWEAKRRFPEREEIRNLLANLSGKRGDFKIAEMLYRQTMADFPQDVVCRAGLAEVLKMQGKLDEAEAIYRQACIDFPNNSLCFNGLARVLLQAGKTKEAEDCQAEIERRFPDDRLGKELAKQFRADQSNAEFSDPDSSSFAEEKDIGLAEPEASPVFSVAQAAAADSAADLAAPDTLETELGLLSLHRQAGDDEEARAILDSLRRKSDALPIPARLEQGFLQLNHDAAAAAEYFRKQSRLHPNAPGFRLGGLRAQAALSGIPDGRQFQELAEQYPAKVTLIRIEQFLLSPAADAADKLRKSVRADISHIPAAERGKEQWLRDAVMQSLFADADISSPVAENFQPVLTEKQAHRLRSAADQCLLAA